MSIYSNLIIENIIMNLPRKLNCEVLSNLANKNLDWNINDVEQIIYDEEQKPEDPNEFLTFKHPARLLVVGKSNSGKSVMALNLIIKYLKYDTLTLIGPTIKLQKKYDLFVDLSELFPVKFRIYDGLKTFKLNNINKNKRNLIVLDDIQELKDVELLKLNTLYNKGRHYNCSTIYLGQTFFRIPIRSRSSASHFIFFANTSKKDMGRIHAELCNEMDKETFVKMFEEATDPITHSFLVIDDTTPHEHLRYRKNFKQLFAGPTIENK